MLAKIFRKYFGGVRLALTMIILNVNITIVMSDVFTKIEVPGKVYGFLGAMLAQVIVYQALETKRKTK